MILLLETIVVKDAIVQVTHMTVCTASMNTVFVARPVFVCPVDNLSTLFQVFHSVN